MVVGCSLTSVPVWKVGHEGDVSSRRLAVRDLMGSGRLLDRYSSNVSRSAANSAYDGEGKIF
jgi:hypothetical protein